MKMNHTRLFRALGLALAVVLTLSAPVCALADTIEVRMPTSIWRLALPDMPEALSLYTWTDSVPTYGNKDNPKDPCPILAVTDAIMHLQFSEQPDKAVASWYEGTEEIQVGADGYAELFTEGHRVQAGFGWSSPRAIEKPWFIKATKDNVTAGYANNGYVRFIEYTIDDDLFGTGIEGAKTVIRFEPITIDGDHYVYETDPDTGKKVKVNLKGKLYDEDGELIHWYYTNWYIPTITTTYPKGNTLSKIVASFWNTEKGTLRKYSVYYSPRGTYDAAEHVSVTKFPYSRPGSYTRTIHANDETTIRVK